MWTWLFDHDIDMSGMQCISTFNRCLTVDDFRGISISTCVISKVFEHAILLERFARYFVTSDNQFGFKNILVVSMLYNVRNIIEHYTDNGSTVSICSFDLRKAFDKMNHYALFIKLMEKKLSNEILNILEQLFIISVTCVKCVSQFFSGYWQVYVKGACCPRSFLPARRRPQGLVVIVVCLSVCLCALCLSARYLKNGFMDHHQIWWVGAGGEPLEHVEFWC